MVAKVEVFVNKDRRVTLQKVANQFSIGKAWAHPILHEKKRYEQVVPKQLTEDQNASMIATATGHLGRFYHDENKFLNCFVTWDEIGLTMTRNKSSIKAVSAGMVMLVAF